MTGHDSRVEREILEALEGALRAIEKTGPNPEVIERARKARWLSIIDAAIERPAYWAIRLQAREVGWMLFTKGGTKLMRAVLEGMTPPFSAQLDTWWDRIGTPNDRWFD